MIDDTVIARSEETKQSSFFAGETKLDCFASLAMTDQTPAIITYLISTYSSMP